jgi:hypothetical protein
MATLGRSVERYSPSEQFAPEPSWRAGDYGRLQLAMLTGIPDAGGTTERKAVSLFRALRFHNQSQFGYTGRFNTVDQTDYTSILDVAVGAQQNRFFTPLHPVLNQSFLKVGVPDRVAVNEQFTVNAAGDQNTFPNGGGSWVVSGRSTSITTRDNAPPYHENYQDGHSDDDDIGNVVCRSQRLSCVRHEC